MGAHTHTHTYTHTFFIVNSLTVFFFWEDLGGGMFIPPDGLAFTLGHLEWSNNNNENFNSNTII